VLSSLAIAQPLFDLLSKNAEFFVAHRVSAAGVLGLTLGLSLAVPSALAALELATGLIGRGPRRVVHTALIFGLLGLTVLPAIKRADLVDGWWDLVLGLAIATAATGAYATLAPVRLFVTVLCPAVVLFPVLFLSSPHVRKLAFPDSQELLTGQAALADADTTVVMVILDELSMASLMTEDLEIDAIRFPSFAALVDDSVWFRNTRSVSSRTTVAVPAILTGREPPEEALLPTLQDHPVNLFTLLAHRYPGIVAFEWVTALCPPEARRNDPLDPQPRDEPSTYADLTAIWLHVVAPQRLAERLPVVTNNWSGFWKDARPSEAAGAADPSGALDSPSGRVQTGGGQPGTFRKFVERIGAEEAPGFYFLHVLLPHVPWRYLPSGKRYTLDSEIHGLEREHWDDDEWPVSQGYQRYLTQTILTDVLLGELILKLREAGLYDDALVVITADHGIAFVPDGDRKTGPRPHRETLLFVPWILKLPGGGRRVIDDEVRSIDIFPTLAEILGAPIPAGVDGRSLVARLEQADTQREDARATELLEARRASIQRFAGWVGPAVEGDPTVHVGAYRAHLGAALETFEVEPTEGALAFDDEAAYADVSLDAGLIPCLVTGTLTGAADELLDRDIAIFVNGELSAVTHCLGRTLRRTRRKHRAGQPAFFSALLPEPSLRAGQNTLQGFFITGPEERPRLLAPSDAPEKRDG
jgi:hypothetical protein